MIPEIVATYGVDGLVDHIDLPPDVEPGDLIVACITAVPIDIDPAHVDGRWNAFGGVANAIVYWGFVQDDTSPIPVEQSDFAGLDAGHTLAVYRGIDTIEDPRTCFKFAVKDDDLGGGIENLFESLPPAGVWHGALSGVVAHGRGVPGQIQVVAPWVNDVRTFTPFYAAACLREDTFTFPHLGAASAPAIWYDGLVSDARVVVTFGFTLTIGIEATRQFPRDDAAGVIGGPRVYPPARSGRVAGGRHL